MSEYPTEENRKYPGLIFALVLSVSYFIATFFLAVAAAHGTNLPYPFLLLILGQVATWISYIVLVIRQKFITKIYFFLAVIGYSIFIFQNMLGTLGDFDRFIFFRSFLLFALALALQFLIISILQSVHFSKIIQFKCIALSPYVVIFTLLFAQNAVDSFGDFMESMFALQTQVSDIKDQLLFSEKGNPIGIRLTYDIKFPFFPRHTKYGVGDLDAFAVSVDANNYPSEQGIDFRWNKNITEFLLPDNTKINNSVFDGGKLYHIVIESIPVFISKFNPHTLCLAGLYEKWYPSIGDEKLHYEYVISQLKDSGNGSRRYGVFKTKNIYNLKTFYDGASKEGVAKNEYCSR